MPIPDTCADSNNEEDEEYSPTPAFKFIRATQKPRNRDPKVILDSDYCAFLRPLTLTFDTK
jgi:hypothetical protein